MKLVIEKFLIVQQVQTLLKKKKKNYLYIQIHDKMLTVPVSQNNIIEGSKGILKNAIFEYSSLNRSLLSVIVKLLYHLFTKIIKI